MKRLHLFSLILISLFLSCKKDEDTLGPGQFKDIDGNIYNSVSIGNQTWMVENLNVTKFRNGDPVPKVEEKQAWINSKNSPAYCVYNNSSSTPGIYGKLFNNKVATDIRNIAPVGWRVPNLDDIAKLRDYIRDNNLNGLALMKKSSDWIDNTNISNSLGFSALPSGYRDVLGNFYNAQDNIANTFIFWTQHVYAENSSSYGLAVKSTGVVELGVYEYSQGLAIRCIKE